MKKIERDCFGEFVRIFLGLSNRNFEECLISLGKKKKRESDFSFYNWEI